MLFYSPKTHIKELWKEIFKLTGIKKNLENSSDSVLESVLSPTMKDLDNNILKRENLINNLIDCYLDPEEDKEFIRDNKP